MQHFLDYRPIQSPFSSYKRQLQVTNFLNFLCNSFYVTFGCYQWDKHLHIHLSHESRSWGTAQNLQREQWKFTEPQTPLGGYYYGSSCSKALLFLIRAGMLSALKILSPASWEEGPNGRPDTAKRSNSLQLNLCFREASKNILDSPQLYCVLRSLVFFIFIKKIKFKPKITVGDSAFPSEIPWRFLLLEKLRYWLSSNLYYIHFLKLAIETLSVL